MDFLTRFSLKNSAVIFLSMILILAGGWYSASNMKSESMPDIDAPFIWMTVVYPGATPNEVSEEIAKPLERALLGLGGLENLTTEAYQNVGVAVLEFGFDVDLDKIWRDVNDTIQKVEFPKEAQKPEIHRANINDSDIIRFAVSGQVAQEEIARFISNVVKPKLASIPGVENVDISGVAEKKIFIKLDPDKMKAHQVTPDGVQQALKFANLSIPAGQVTMGDKLIPIEVKKETRNIEDIKKIRLVSLDTGKVFEDAFGSVGEGFSQMAAALAQLGVSMQEGFTGLGQAQLVTQTQVQLLAGIQSLETLIAEDQYQLQALQGQPVPPQQIEGLKQKIAAEQTQLQLFMAQLEKINNEVMAGAGVSNSGKLDELKKPSFEEKGTTLNSSPQTSVVTLGNVADVSYGYAKKTFLSRTNGQPGVTFSLTRQSGANVVEVSDKAKEIIQSMKLPEGYKIEVLFDLAVPIKSSIQGMIKESILGAFFAVVVIYVFLRNFRTTVVAITAIPLSIFATFIVLKWLNYSINIMTLSGMAVAVGRVVDDGIVVIENIFRRLSGEKGDAGLVREATREVAGAITSSTITTIAVFAPLTVVSGIVGKVFIPFAVTVVFALAFSLLVAFTVIPLLGRILLLKVPLKNTVKPGGGNWYGRLLRWSLNHAPAVITIAVLVLILSGGLATRIGTNFLPQDKVRNYQASIKMPIGSSLEKTDEVTRKVEAILNSEPGVKTYQASIGDQGTASLFISFTDDVEDTKALAEDIRYKFNGVDGAQDISLQELGRPGGNPMLQVVVNGDNAEEVRMGGLAVTQALKDVPGLANITSNLEDVKPQIVINVNEALAAQKGLSPLMVAGTIRSMISGDVIGKINIEGEPKDMVLSLDGGEISNIESVKKLELFSMTGEKVPVGAVAQVSMKPGPTAIMSRNSREFVSVEALITDSNTGKVDAIVKEKLQATKLPEGVTYAFEGNTAMMAAGFHDMTIAMAVAVALVFIVMVAAFGNVRAPLAILFSLPMAVIGSLLGLFITGEELGMPALIGGLMLIGIVVTNAIVLVDRVQSQIKAGFSVDEALVEAGRTRFRPIMMTALTTIIALIPLAATPAEGALISRSMAVVVIGGLTTSTALTLIVVPVVYRVISRIANSFAGSQAEKDMSSS